MKTLLEPFFCRRLEASLRQGSVLLLVLVTVAMMTLTAGSYLVLMQNEHTATRYNGRRQQARLLVESGVEYLQAILAQSDDEINQQGGLWNNPDLLQSVLVADDSMAAFRGRFTVLANDLERGEYSGLRYGLENESAKLNLNTLVEDDDQENDTARERLLAIPGMEASVADAILDWLDEDNLPREFGVESSYYQELSPAYQPRNGRLGSLDELLMVKGVTAQLLYGLDANRSYAIEAQEEPPPKVFEQLDNSQGQLNRGWSAYLTLYSQERLITPDGEERINVNAENLNELYNKLLAVINEDEAKFIIAYRQNAAASQNTTSQAANLADLIIDWERKAQVKILSLYDLIGARVSVPGKGNAPSRIFESPWQENPTNLRKRFTVLLDHCQVDDTRQIAGRINIDVASRPVLMSVPGMTELVVDQILNQRETREEGTLGQGRHPAWILTEGIVTLEEMKQIAPYVTTGGDVYSAQVVGYFESSTPRSRAEIILDRSGNPPQIISWQDLTKLGPGIARRLLGEEEDRNK